MAKRFRVSYDVGEPVAAGQPWPEIRLDQRAANNGTQCYSQAPRSPPGVCQPERTRPVRGTPLPLTSGTYVCFREI